MRSKHPSAFLFRAALLCLLAWIPRESRAADAPLVLSEGSIKPVPPAVNIGPNDPHRAYIKRNNLLPAEVAGEMRFEVALKMRNFPELQARITRGEIIPFAEMAAKYYPTQADYQAVAAWMTGQGFKITRQDDNHLAVFASASVGAVQKALRVNFARVSLEGVDYTSAITAPSVPAGLAPLLVGINGLQPHIRAHKHIVSHKNSLTGTSQPYTPAQILHAYGANQLALSGSGQTIAIVIDVFPKPSDLTKFWSTCGVAQSGSNISYIPAVSGSLAAPSGEESLDTEWSSSIAPGAKVRIYAATDLAYADLDTAYQYVFADVVANPGYNLHQLSMSYGGGEYYNTAAQVITDSQYFANLASAGITLFASSGDGADDPNGVTGAPGGRHVTVENPASDPSVTAVGGTSLTLNSGSFINTETAWNDSGGGFSIYFSRPTWQTGTGLPSVTARCVPDVSSPADPSEGAYVELDGSLQVFGGTSWSSPTWAGYCALINQSRAKVGLPPIGLLGPKLYPLIGTTNFHDIVSGGNGYNAGVGYDLVTGIGSPYMQNLVPTLLGLQTAPPVITLTPNQNTTFTVASSATATSYQWQRMPIGTSMWSNIPASGTYAGVTTGTLAINGVIPAMSGDQFQCLVATGTNVVTTAPPSTLVVDNQLVVTTLAGQALVTGTANGSGTNAQFNIPSGVAIDSFGNQYIADFSNDTIREVTPAGVVTTPYGQPGISGSNDGSGTNALFNTPNAVAIDGSNNIYVADSGNSTIRKITPAGVVNTIAGLAGATGTDDGTGTAAQFDNPQGIAVDDSGSYAYVADTGNETIREVLVSSGSVSTIAGLQETGGYANGTGTAAQFNGPIAVAVDSSENVYVTDLYNYVVRKVAPGGVVTTPYGQAGIAGRLDGLGAATQFNSPIGICIDGSGNLYVTDSQIPAAPGSNSSGNNTVRRINPAGVVSTIAGTPGVTGTANGTGPAAQFFSLQAVGINRSGVVYLCDTFNDTIRAGGLAPLITPLEGTQTVTAGQPASFSVSAAGSGSLTYQWFFDGTMIGSATSATYTIPDASSGNGGSYTLMATDPYGSGTSSIYTLTVNNPVPALIPVALAVLWSLFFLVTGASLRVKQTKT